MFLAAFSRYKSIVLSLFLGAVFVFGTVHAGVFFSTEEGGTRAEVMRIDSDESSTTFIDLLFGNSNSALRYDIPQTKFIFNRNIDLSDYQLLNTRIENLASAPTCDAARLGKIYINTGSKNSYICNGTSFVQIDSAGGGTLNSSYDFGGAGAGRTITVDSGAVVLSGIGTVLELGNGTANNITLSFNDGTARTLTWDDPNSRFVLNSNFRIEGSQAVEGIVYIAGNQAATDSDGVLSLGRNASVWKTLTFDATTDDRFEFNDDLDVAGILSATSANFNDGQISNFRIENLSSDTCSSGLEGKLYYDTDDDHGYICNGTSWVAIDSTGGGGGTLDAAYDYGGAGAGRTITVDSGAVALSGIGTVLQLGDGTANNIALSFYDGTARTLTWDDTNSRFVTNSSFRVEGNQATEGMTYIATDHEATDSDGVLNLGRNGSVWETLTFDATTNDRFELSDDLDVGGILSADTISIDTTPPTYSSTARPTRKVTLVPEYPGAVMTPDGTSNSGTMTSDFCENGVSADIPNTNTAVCNTIGDIHNYYTWDQAGGAVEDYDIWIRWRMPDNFSAWASNPISVWGKRTDTTNNAVIVYVYDTAGALENSGGTQVAGTNWTNTSIESSFSGTYTAGSYMTIQIRMVSDAGGDIVHVGEISLDYLSNN